MKSKETSEIMGSSPTEQYGFESAAEHEVLCEMNADFHRSKVELIHRFLSDQEELNKRFAEYALNTDDESSENEGIGGDREHYNYAQHRAKPPTLTEEDILQDLECRSVLDDDNLSTASAINSSLGSGSDIAVLDEENTFDGQFHASREGTFVVKDQNGNFSGNKMNRLGRGMVASKVPGQARQADLSPTRVAKKEVIPNRKTKKILVKKNVRPQTAAGIRRGPNLRDEAELLQQRLEEEQARVAMSRQESPSAMALPHGYTQQPPGSRGSQRSATRTRTSWLEDQLDSEPVPYRKSNDHAGRNRHPQATLLSHGGSVFMDRASYQTMGYDTGPMHMNNGVQIYPSTEYGNRQNSGSRSRSLAGGGGGLLSIDISPNKGRIDPAIIPSRGATPLGDRDYMDGRCSVSSNRSDRNLYSAGRRKFANQPQLSDVTSTSKRKITVLKLPPLEGSVTVNKSIVDQGRFVSSGPKGSVTPATEFMAG